jgi:glutathione S-transferase
MKLRLTPIDGYVSTVEAVVTYTGTGDRIEPVATNPFETDSGLPELNPLSTVPTLVMDDGEVLFGGLVIYEYLDTLHDKPRLFPQSGPNMWIIRRRAWQADALFDLSVKLILEGMEDEATRRSPYVLRQWAKMERAMDLFEKEAPTFGDLEMAQVRLMGALSFIAPRMKDFGEKLVDIDPTHDWRAGRPVLSAWYDRLADDPIFTTNLIAT